MSSASSARRYRGRPALPCPNSDVSPLFAMPRMWYVLPVVNDSIQCRSHVAKSHAMQMLQRSWCLSRICSSAIAWRVLCAVVLLSAVCDAGEKKQVTFAMDKKHPGQFLCVPEESWVDTATLEFDVVVSNDVPSESQVLVHIKDWDYFWYQKVVPGYLVPGKTNHFRIDMSPDAEGWKPTGHHGAWHFRALMEPKEIGIRVFKDSKYERACQLTNVFRVASRKDDESPSIETVVGASMVTAQIASSVATLARTVTLSFPGRGAKTKPIITLRNNSE